MLTCHRQITVPPECGFIHWLFEKYRNVDWNDPGCYEQFSLDVVASKKFETWGVSKIDLVTMLENIEPVTYAEACQSVIAAYERKHDKTATVFGDKNNYYLNHILLLNEIFPQCKFIHIVRDGRDVACSYKELAIEKQSSKFKPNLPTDINAIACDWKTNVNTIQEAFSQLEPSKVIEIRFGDLVKETKKQLTTICKFLGLEYDSTMENYASLNRQLELEPRALLGWKKDTTKPPVQQKSGRYLTDLTKDEILKFEQIAEAELKRYGF